MENIATIEVNEEHQGVATSAVHNPTSAPALRVGHNIDGFFRPRTVTISRTVNQPAIDNNIAALAAQQSAIPSAPEIRSVITRAVNHTRAHLPQAARSRTISVDHTNIPIQSVAVSRHQPNHVHHHVAQHSQTLRRDTVPSPEQSTHNALRPNGTLQHRTPGLIEVKKSADVINPDRLVRAGSTPKNPLVARHATEATSALAPLFAPVAVQPTPGPTFPPVAPPPAPGNDGVPPAPSPTPDNRPTDIFEHALANANHYVDLHAHKTSYRKKARVHVASMVFGSLALIVVASFVAYQNSPALQLKVASVKAGVSTDMPNFAAAGFAYNGIQANNDRLTFGFKGSRGNYELTQTSTNFNDANMIQAIGATTASGTPVYQVVMAGNTMVYRFNNTNATWVSNGEWYTVSGSNALTDQQIASLVQHT